MSAAELEVDALLLTDPERAEQVLHAYFSLLGDRRLWWQRCAESDDPCWPRCVRAAIVHVGRTAQVDPGWLADVLDDGGLPQTRRRIVRLARERLYARVAA